jgi:hypothetical protein
VASNSVRVWTGFKKEEVPVEKFFERLGSYFMPGTVQIQSQVGLTAYLPSVLPADKPAGVPDEIALVFYAYQEAYYQAKQTVAGRAYGDLHKVAFDDVPVSISGFPAPFAGELAPKGRYTLFDHAADWQKGVMNVLVGVPKSGSENFLAAVADWLKQVQDQVTDAPDGAWAAAGEQYVVYWEHWPTEAAAEESRISSLTDLVDAVYQQTPIPRYDLYDGLWADFPPLPVKGGESYNFRFRSRLQPWQ